MIPPRAALLRHKVFAKGLYPMAPRLRILVFVFILAVAGASLAGTPSENKALVLKSVAAMDASAFDDLDKYLAPNFVRHCQATPEAVVESLDDFKALLRSWSKTYSNVVTKIDVLVAEGDLVAFYGSYSATQIGPMGPFPATGKQIVSEFSGYHRIAKGKIAETWVTWDNLAALVQLGLFPLPDKGAASSD